MKKVLVICLIALISGVTSFAADKAPQQRSGNRGMDSKKRMEQMYKDLNLNEQQKKQFQKINDDFMEKMKKQREAGETDRQKMRENMQKMQNEREAQIKKVLTDEQYKQYTKKQEEMKKQMEENRNKRGNRGEGGQRGQRGQRAPQGRPTGSNWF